MRTYTDRKTGKEVSFPGEPDGSYNVKKVVPLEEYQLKVYFADGKVKIVDLKENVETGPVFEPLKDPGVFKLAKVKYHTVVWPGDIDIAPEYLYDFGKEVKM